VNVLSLRIYNLFPGSVAGKIEIICNTLAKKVVYTPWEQGHKYVYAVFP